MGLRDNEWDSNGRGSLADGLSLRGMIDAATAADQAKLDRAVPALHLVDRENLVRCLGTLFAAHADVERWLAENCPTEWVPPPQTGAIADDLIALGGSPSAFPAPPFEPGVEGLWIGPAYAISHLQLGVRLMLAQAEPPLPPEARRFLTGTEMQAYCRRLSAALSHAPGPDGAEDAIAGARATIGHFRACLARFAETRLAVA